MAIAARKIDLRRQLSEAPFTKVYGLKLHSIADGECTLEVPFRATFERPGRIVAGPVLMAAADVAMWLAIMTRLGKGDRSVTAEMKTSFLSAARQEGFRCTARILKLGRRLIYGVAECVGTDGKLLAHHTLTYVRSDSA
jgi:uncharacterized protein (TIGR00369 family)